MHLSRFQSREQIHRHFCPHRDCFRRFELNSIAMNANGIRGESETGLGGVNRERLKDSRSIEFACAHIGHDKRIIQTPPVNERKGSASRARLPLNFGSDLHDLKPGGECFRSVWKVGWGSSFYFRPGHEFYPVFKEQNIIEILENAVRWPDVEQRKS